MGYLSRLSAAVEDTCQSGQIGIPVFVRCTAALSEEVGLLPGLAAELAGHVNCWLSALPHRLYALSSKDHSHVSLSLEYPNGCTALLAVALAHDQPQIDLAVLGAAGAIYHKEKIDRAQEGQLATELPAQIPSLLQAIKQSLLTGNPITISERA